MLVLPSRRSERRLRSPSRLAAVTGLCLVALGFVWATLSGGPALVHSPDPLKVLPSAPASKSSSQARSDTHRSAAPVEPVVAIPSSSQLPTITGVVFDATGQRLAGARIELRPSVEAGAARTLESDGPALVTVSSASNGVFSIPCTDDEVRCDMVVRAMECAPAVRESVFPGSHHEIHLSAATGEVHGAISDTLTGAPIAGASVGIRREDTFDVRRTLTDIEGRFAFRDLTEGAFTLVAAGAEHRASTHAAHVRCGERTQVDVALERTEALDILCVDERSGAPIEDVAIDLGHLQVRTDEAGRARVPAAASPIEVVQAQFIKTGYAGRVQRLEADPAGVCTVRLGPGATCAVRIELAPGIGNATPRCHFKVTTLGGSRQTAAELSRLASHEWLASLSGVPEGALVEAIAGATGAALARARARPLSTPAIIDDLPVLRLSPGAAAMGVVVDSLGAPLDGVLIAMVRAQELQPTVRTFAGLMAVHRRVHTDARGNWTIPDLPQGAMTLLAYAPGFELYEREIELSVPSQEPIHIGLTRSRGTAGPLEGVVRACGCACEATICAVNAYGQRWHTVSDGNGRFAFRELPAGEYALLGTFTRAGGMRTHGSRERYRPGDPLIALDFDLR